MQAAIAAGSAASEFKLVWRLRMKRFIISAVASLAIAGCGGAPDVAGPRSAVGLAAGPSAVEQ